MGENSSLDAHPYSRLTPDLVLDAVAASGLAPDGRLLPDMSARVVFLAALDSRPGSSNGKSVVIPRGALRRDPDGRFFVWLAEEGRSRRVPVEAGDALGDRVVILAGLSGGAEVILGTAPEHEGQRVETGPQ